MVTIIILFQVTLASEKSPKLIHLIFSEDNVILQARHITKWFGEIDSKTFALHDVSFDVSYGEMLYIVGPSGSGKTTLLSIISGILRPNEGTVIVKNKTIWTLGGDALAGCRLCNIGFVFQDFHLFDKLTARENVAIPLILQ